MRILALETSTELGSCAFWQDGALIERQCPVGRPHSETLLPLIREMLREAGLDFSRLDAVAFGAGPGAFTGLRVACGVAQGLAVAAGVPVVPVGTLEALAEASGAQQVLALLDARMGEVYYGAFRRDEKGLEAVGDIRVLAPDAVELPDGTEWLACGNALGAYPELANRLAGEGIEMRSGLMPMAGSVARLAAYRYEQGLGLDPAQAVPLYVRDKVAQTVAERLAGGGKA